ncbi:MAG: hypothetical protein ACRYFB_03770 [Janthinobacterium lividum]
MRNNLQWFDNIWNDSVGSKVIANLITYALIFLFTLLIIGFFSSGLVKTICLTLSVVLLIIVIISSIYKSRYPGFIIMEPEDFEEVKNPIRVRGKYNALTKNRKYMIVVLNEINNTYWPKDIVEFDTITKSWFSEVGIGGGNGEKRTIIIASLEPYAKELIDLHKKTNSNTGLSTSGIMNKHMKIFSQVTVIISKNN